MLPASPLKRSSLSPTEAYQEGLRFFAGKGMINNALRRVARDLEEKDIDYTVIGAVALNQHGYRRFTEDIDLLLTKDGLQKFRGELVGRGYRPAFEGATRMFRTAEEGVTVEVVTTGEYPGDGRPKSVQFPRPADVSVEIDGVQIISLEKLIELKLASGLSSPDRLRDLADVQELIKIKDLPADFRDQLDPSVRDKFTELQHAVEMGRKRNTDLENPDNR